MADSRLQAYSDVLPLLHALPRIEAENGHGPGTLKASAGPSLTCSGVDCELSFLHGLTHIKNKVLLCKKHKAAHHCDHHCTVAHLPPLSLSFSFSLSLSFSLFLFLSFSFSLSLSLSLSLSDASLGLTPANAMTAPLASSLSVFFIFLYFCALWHRPPSRREGPFTAFVVVVVVVVVGGGGVVVGGVVVVFGGLLLSSRFGCQGTRPDRVCPIWAYWNINRYRHEVSGAWTVQLSGEDDPVPRRPYWYNRRGGISAWKAGGPDGQAPAAADETDAPPRGPVTPHVCTQARCRRSGFLQLDPGIWVCRASSTGHVCTASQCKWHWRPPQVKNEPDEAVPKEVFLTWA